MGTVKVTQQGDTFTIEDADDEVHTGLSLSEVATLCSAEEGEVLEAIANGEAGVGYLDVEEDVEEEDLEDEDDDEAPEGDVEDDNPNDEDPEEA